MTDSSNGSCADGKTGCNGTLPVTAEIAQYLKEQGFKAFSSHTHLVAMPHLMPDVIDWISALIKLGLPADHIHLLAKQYSQVDATRDKLRNLGVDVMDYTAAPVGGYYETLDNIDLPKFWRRSMSAITKAQTSSPKQDVLVMDDGGRLLHSIPPELTADKNIRIAGVEQTTNGYEVAREEGHKIDIIIPARSALKLECEAPFIADAAIRKLRDKLGIFKNRDVAVIGIGNIGSSVASTLADNHNNVFIFDNAVHIKKNKVVDPKHLLPPHVNIYSAPDAANPHAKPKMLRKGAPPANSSYFICRSLEQAVQHSNYVFGCTGRDIFKDTDLDHLQFQGAKKKLDETRFISVSSGDKEFRSLLQWVSNQAVFTHQSADGKKATRWDVTANHHGSRLRIVQQGFPVNFDGKTCSGTPEEMQLVSCLLLASIVQGYEYLQKYPVKSANDHKNLIMFSPPVQKKIFNAWMDGVPNVRSIFNPERLEEIAHDEEWFRKHSAGEFCPVFDCDYPTPHCSPESVKPGSKAIQQREKHG
jgi:hypothetical protein